jgi:hypothetical protein
VHLLRFIPFDEVGLVTVTAEKLFQFLSVDAGQDGGIGDLVAVKVEDGQDRPRRSPD